jgi:hypothetical protein
MVYIMKEEKGINDEAEEREYNIKIAYKNGLLEGVKRYSWLEDGIRYVGTAKKPLDAAIQEIEEEYEYLKP